MSGIKFYVHYASTTTPSEPEPPPSIARLLMKSSRDWSSQPSVVIFLTLNPVVTDRTLIVPLR